MAAPSVPVSFNYGQKTIRVTEFGAVLSRSDHERHHILLSQHPPR